MFLPVSTDLFSQQLVLQREDLKISKLKEPKSICVQLQSLFPLDINMCLTKVPYSSCVLNNNVLQIASSKVLKVLQTLLSNDVPQTFPMISSSIEQ
jgi:hypothetical protein